jgi:hypothetical protein
MEVFVVLRQSGDTIFEIFSTQELADGCVAAHGASTEGGLEVEAWTVETSPLSPPVPVPRKRRKDFRN